MLMAKSGKTSENGISERERRKMEQWSAIVEKREAEKLWKTAKRIVKKGLSDRYHADVAFVQKHKSLIEDAEKRRDEKLLDRKRQEELFDSAEELQAKCLKLAEVMRNSRHVVVYTGAGISTAADIPDYRGPNGLWTRQERGLASVDPDRPFDLTKAQPTFTHMALVCLQKQGFIKHVVSQNCDGLHVRSGFPRESLSEVHGNMYLEVCDTCDPDREYFRSFDLTQKTRWRRHRTGRKCHECNGDLQDTIVLFGEKSRTETPMLWERARENVQKADVVICLGTSLKVLKDYPTLWNPASRLFIVNLQWTPKDDECELKIHGRCDDVMRQVMNHLSLIPPVYDKSQDPLLELAVPLRDDEELSSSANGANAHTGCGWFAQGLQGVRNKKEKQRKVKQKRKKR